MKSRGQIVREMGKSHAIFKERSKKLAQLNPSALFTRTSKSVSRCSTQKKGYRTDRTIIMNNTNPFIKDYIEKSAITELDPFKKFHDLLMTSQFGKSLETDLLLNYKPLLDSPAIVKQGKLETLRKIWTQVADNNKVLTMKRAGYVVSEVLSDMRQFIRRFVDDEAMVHIIQWGEIFAYVLGKLRKDTEWELGYDSQKFFEREARLRDAYEKRITELEKTLKIERQRSKKEIEELKEILKKMTSERDQLKEDLHYKLQETCKAFLQKQLDTQQKYVGAESMDAMERLLGQLGTTLRNTEEMIESKGSVLVSFQSMVKLIRLSHALGMKHKQTQTDFSVTELKIEDKEIPGCENYISHAFEYLKRNFDPELFELYNNQPSMYSSGFEKATNEILMFTKEYNQSGTADICTRYILHKYNEKSKVVAETFRFFKTLSKYKSATKTSPTELLKAALVWESLLQDTSLGYIFSVLYQGISQQKGTRKELSLHGFYKTSKLVFQNNLEAYNLYVQTVALLALSDYKVHESSELQEYEVIQNAKKNMKAIKTVIATEVTKYEASPKASIYCKRKENGIESAEVFDRYLEIIRTKLLATNEGLSRTVKKYFKEYMLMQKNALSGNEFVELVTKKIKFPLTENEALSLKSVLERGHKDQIYLVELLKFMAPSSTRDFSSLKDTFLNEELLYVGVLIAAEKYHKKLKARIINEVDEEPLKGSLQFFNEFATYSKAVNPFVEDKKVEDVFLSLSKSDPKRVFGAGNTYHALKTYGIVPSFYKYATTNLLT